MRLLVNEGRGYRADLEGIRGIGLLFILSAHLIEWPTGGYVFLDLFFVLSGYLITGLLMRDFERNGSVRVFRFYRRRIRRLSPAATLVVVVTVAVGFLLFPLARAVSVGWDGVWSMLLVANWNFALNGTDYFATWLPQSPLLHYWSLSVEEQFYMVWPGLIVIGLAIAGFTTRRQSSAARRHRSYRYVIILIALLSLASFAWGVIQPMTNPAVSYLSSLTRAWELGVGALLFFANAWWARMPRPLAWVLAWGGLAALVVSALILTPETPYPSWWALIPVLATGGIIVAGVGGSSSLVAASNPVSRYLGQISYSVYLWHWPIFVYIAAVVGEQSPIYLWGAAPLALIVGALAFHFVEDPIRRSQWLEPGTRRHRRHRHSHERRSRNRSILVRVGAAASVVVTVAVVALAVLVPRPGAADPSGSAAAGPTPTPAVTAAPAPTGASAIADIEQAVRAALDAETWPEPVVAQIDAGDANANLLLGDVCLNVTEDVEDQCVFGDATLPKSAVLLGDSVALSWVPGLAPALNDKGYRLHVLIHSQCPFADVTATGSFDPGAADTGFAQVCADHRAWARDRTAQLAPDLVVAADGEAELQTIAVPADMTPADYWQQGMVASANALGGTPLVVLNSPPQASSILECYTRVATVDDCTARIEPQWRDMTRANTAAAAQAATPFTVIDPRLWFCTSDGWCPPFADDTVIRSDRQHISIPYARRLTPVIAEALDGVTP